LLPKTPKPHGELINQSKDHNSMLTTVKSYWWARISFLKHSHSVEVPL